MKLKITAAVILLSMTSTAQISVKFENKTNKSISVKIAAGPPSAPVESFKEYAVQTIAANSTSPNFIKLNDIKKNSKIIVTGSIADMGNYKFYELNPTVKNQELTIPLSLNVTAVPPDNLSYQKLIAELNFNPPKNSSKIMGADVAFKSYFGGLSVRNKDSVEIDRIEPTVLKAEVIPIQYGSIRRTSEAFFSGNFITGNKGAAPGIASINLNVENQELYKLKYILDDAGTVAWSAPSGKSIAVLFSEMSEIDRTALVQKYLQDSTITLHQYDQIYLIKALTLKMENYKKTATTIDANVPIFFSNSTAFKKDEMFDFTASATTTVLNVWSTKNVTSLLVTEAQKYLEKQRQLVQNATSNREAQNIVTSNLVVDNIKLIDAAPTATKVQINNEIQKSIRNMTRRLRLL